MPVTAVMGSAQRSPESYIRTVAALMDILLSHDFKDSLLDFLGELS